MTHALILNGGGAESPYKEILALAEGWTRGRGFAPAAIDLTVKEIRPCLGCFHCWLKTPGICSTRDAMDEILPLLAVADLLVLITPVSYGGYGFHLKKALDRSIPILLPFFEWRQGEMHHPLRYEYGKRKLLGIGILPEADAESERIFHHLVWRNAINMHADPASLVIDGQKPGKSITDRLAAIFILEENRP